MGTVVMAMRRRFVVEQKPRGKATMAQDDENDGMLDVPVISGMNGKIGVLERRREHLRRKLGRAGYGETHSAQFDRAEVAALDAAIRTMRYHAATLMPHLDPVVHLARVVDAVGAVAEEHDFRFESDAESDLDRRMREARIALDELV